ncbi:MAG: hypothetical protein ACK5RS_16930, partial [Acidobacteriota bacterium]
GYHSFCWISRVRGRIGTDPAASGARPARETNSRLLPALLFAESPGNGSITLPRHQDRRWNLCDLIYWLT